MFQKPFSAFNEVFFRFKKLIYIYIIHILFIHYTKMNILQITKPNYTECSVNNKLVDSKIIIDNEAYGRKTRRKKRTHRSNKHSRKQ